MGVGGIFFREGPTVDFPGVAKNIYARGGTKVAKFYFTHSESNKTTLICKKCEDKMSNFKIHSVCKISVKFQIPLSNLY